ncbi:MAG: ribonuclease P protein component [Phycisphaeraceae bacterium]
MTEAGRFRFTQAQRLHGRVAFARVFEGGMRRQRGPLVVWMLSNDLPMSRLGLTVPGRVGTNVVRNRVKRLLREAFRLRQHELPAGYDVVVVVRPHEPADLTTYQRWLCGAIVAAAR